MQTLSKEPPARTEETRATETIASFPTYPEAQAAVDRLSDAKFAVKHVAIVGEGLKFVEQVTGRLTWWRAILRGLGSGAFLGLFVGLLLGLFVFDPRAWFAVLIYGLLFGAGVGAIFHLIGYLATGGRRDFSSLEAFDADRFAVVCNPRHSEEARRLLKS